jgi:hypothetical protein
MGAPGAERPHGGFRPGQAGEAWAPAYLALTVLLFLIPIATFVGGKVCLKLQARKANRTVAAATPAEHPAGAGKEDAGGSVAEECGTPLLELPLSSRGVRVAVGGRAIQTLCSILSVHGESRIKYTKRRLSGSIAHG